MYWYKAIVRCTHLVARILQHGCKFSSWLKVNKISNQTVHHQSATKLDSMMNYSLENRIWRQTSGWVTCAKPSRQYTDPGVSYTFSRRFLNQNYPKYISDVVSKILVEKIKSNYQMFYLNLWSSRNWVSWWWKLKIFIANFSHVSPNWFWRIFSMLFQSHPTIEWRWKKFLFQLVWC